MEMWVKSDYLRVFLRLLRPISRPILFPLSLDKQPISLARSHNWLFPLSQTAVPPCDGIQSAPSAQNSSFTFKLTDRVTMRKLGMRWRLAVFKNYKWPEALNEITEGQWGSVTVAVRRSSLLRNVNEGHTQIRPFSCIYSTHSFFQVLVWTVWV